MSEQKVVYDETQIEVLEGLEPVRKRAGMYIGSTGLSGLHHLVYEIVNNSIDEALMGECNEINIKILKDNSVTVKDDGRGIPCGIHPKKGISTLEVILSTLHAGGKFGEEGYIKTGGLHGVGTSVVNALSDVFIATVHRDGNVYEQSYSKGKKTSEVKIIGKTEEKGTIIEFHPDTTIFEDINFDFNVLENRLKELAFLNKGILITLTDERVENLAGIYQYEGGIKEYIDVINNDKEILQKEVLYVNKSDATTNCDVEIAFQYANELNESLRSFVNNIYTPDGGSHVNGFYQSMAKMFTSFARENSILKDKDVDFIKDDIKEGLTCIISTRVVEPEFEGQTKGKLGTGYVQTVVSTILKDFLELYTLENHDEALVVCQKIYNTQQARLNTRKIKENTKASARKQPLPSKLADCSSTDVSERELNIVEGDSAGGSAKDGAFRRFQAVLASRGKILNVEKQKFDRIASSEELVLFGNAIGEPLGEKYKEENLRYSKIIIMSDADVDGFHIRTLWMTYCYRHYIELIENGHLYISQPPLYKITKGKEEVYAYSDKELEEELLRLGLTIEEADIQRYKGLGEMNATQMRQTTMNPSTRRLYRVTVKDAQECSELIKILMGDIVEPRKEFIKKYSGIATLDV